MRRSVAGLSSIAGLIFCGSAHGIILESTGDTTANTAAPTGSFSNSGWQYEGVDGGYSITAIGPHTFISASHIAPFVGLTFTFNGGTYTVTGTSTGSMAAGTGTVTPSLAGRDLVIVSVSQTTPYWAPIYNPSTDGSVVGKTEMDIGRGTQRGTAINVTTSRGTEGTLRGWNWGPSDGVQRWGTNVITGFTADQGITNNYFDTTFDLSGQTNESTISSGDSGGGVFVQGANGVWKLAGVNSAVNPDYSFDGVTSAGNGAIFDFRDLYILGTDNKYHLAQDFFGTGSPIPQTDNFANVSDVPSSVFAAYLPHAGDINLDGKVNASDFDVLASHYGMSNEHWQQGDLNYDGVVNLADFNLLAAAFNQTSGASALGTLVPEPCSAATLLVTALSVASSRRRRQAAR